MKLFFRVIRIIFTPLIVFIKIFDPVFVAFLKIFKRKFPKTYSFCRKIYYLYKNSFSGLSKEVWLLTIVNFINRCGTMVVPFLSIYLHKELGFTIEQAGLVVASFGAGSVVGTYIGGILTDKIGYYHIMFWSLLGAGFIFISMQWVTTYHGWLAIIFVASLVADTFRPASMTAVGVLSKPENRTRSISLIRMAINAGWAIGPAIAGVMAEKVGYAFLFWGDGLTFIVAAIFFILMVPKRAKTNFESDEPEATTSNANSVYSDWLFLTFVGLILLSAISFFQLFVTVPLFYETELNLSKDVIGYLMAMNGILIAIIEMPTVFVLEKKNFNLELSAIGVLIMGFSFWILGWTTWAGIALISMLIVTVGEIFAMPFANAFAINRPKPENRGMYMALYGMSYSVGFIVGPWLGTTLVANYGWSTMWTVLASFSLVSGIGLWFLAKKIKEEAVDLAEANKKAEKEAVIFD